MAGGTMAAKELKVGIDIEGNIRTRVEVYANRGDMFLQTFRWGVDILGDERWMLDSSNRLTPAELRALIDALQKALVLREAE